MSLRLSFVLFLERVELWYLGLSYFPYDKVEVIIVEDEAVLVCNGSGDSQLRPNVEHDMQACLKSSLAHILCCAF